ncbi:hypothetical protein QBC37DRAFT_191837 [Rhypophila decipiens]|uniref:Uncharacterized protein n=1 Tax=Rhypophila decipiens TaxID=261697 RepID=A0AAN7B912_9PEZI|nr:hypothetical protein QBC37DRAFT_191837 [Rhypophila decipiens]
MRFEHFIGVDRFAASGCLAYSLLLNDNLTAAQLSHVDEVDRSEPPPRANSTAEVTENCQGWTIRVLVRLAAEGIVEESAVQEFEGGDGSYFYWVMPSPVAKGWTCGSVVLDQV